MFPEHLRLQIKESDTALSDPKVKITFDLDARASEIFQRHLHISEIQDNAAVLGELCLINFEINASQQLLNTRKNIFLNLNPALPL